VASKQNIVKRINNQAITNPYGCLLKNYHLFILVPFLSILTDCLMSGGFLLFVKLNNLFT